MNKDFPRIITYLRKERGLSQRQVADDLEISQALLSHYEKGIRECGLDFLVKSANYYDVSCDYLLGRTSDRQGAMLIIDENQQVESDSNSPIAMGTIMPVVNRRLLNNSINIIFGILQKANNKNLTKHISNYLMVGVYKAFRLLYCANSKNQNGIFSVSEATYGGFSDASMAMSYTKASCDCQNKKNAISCIELSSDIISQEYPESASALFNLIKHSEKRINTRTST